MSNVKRIPVFVFPSSINFYLDDQTSYKQTLTLYNPYDFPLKFRVLSTAPNKYYVSDPEGSLGPQMYVDIVVRHTQPNPGNCNVTDKFRVNLLDHATKQLLGKKDLSTVLHEHERESSFAEGDNFHAFQTDTESSVSARARTMRGASQRRRPSAVALACVVCVACMAALFLPTAQETFPETSIPSTFHLSSKVKLVLSCVLGGSLMIVLH